jgi:preprotein translocase subunit Sec63
VLVRTNSIARRIFGWRDQQTTARQILGVDATASSETIRHAYRELVQIWHPDRFAHDPVLRQQAEAATKRINEAYWRLYRGKRTHQRFARRSRADSQHTSPTHGDRGSVNGASSVTLPTWMVKASIILLVLAMSLAASALLVYLMVLLD